jgi:hypothetical protein
MDGIVAYFEDLPEPLTSGFSVPHDLIVITSLGKDRLRNAVVIQAGEKQAPKDEQIKALLSTPYLIGGAPQAHSVTFEIEQLPSKFASLSLKFRRSNDLDWQRSGSDYSRQADNKYSWDFKMPSVNKTIEEVKVDIEMTNNPKDTNGTSFISKGYLKDGASLIYFKDNDARKLKLQTDLITMDKATGVTSDVVIAVSADAESAALFMKAFPGLETKLRIGEGKLQFSKRGTSTFSVPVRLEDGQLLAKKDSLKGKIEAGKYELQLSYVGTLTGLPVDKELEIK